MCRVVDGSPGEGEACGIAVRTPPGRERHLVGCGRLRCTVRSRRSDQPEVRSHRHPPSEEDAGRSGFRSDRRRVTYPGRDMKETHAGMGVTAGEFDALVAELVASLAHPDVPKEAQAEPLGLLAPIWTEIEETEPPPTDKPPPAT